MGRITLFPQPSARDYRVPLRHGHCMDGRTSPTYNSWSTMIQRCTNPRTPMYPHYGGRGITIDPRWLKFDNFLADMGDRPAGHTLDRIDNDGPYCKANCRWATASEQRRNMPRPATCRRGHAWTPENTFITTTGHRQCRTCRRLRELAG